MIKYIDSYLPLSIRVSFVIGYFFLRGLYDYKKNVDNPIRAKEYLYLVSCILIAITYSIIQGIVSRSFSIEYFTLGKGINNTFYDSIVLAIKGSYWVGVVIGVLYLFVNTRVYKNIAVDYRYLLKNLKYPFCYACLLSFLFFFLYPIFVSLPSGYEKILINMQSFKQVWGMHTGSYLGGTLGTLHGVYRIFDYKIKSKKDD